MCTHINTKIKSKFCRTAVSGKKEMAGSLIPCSPMRNEERGEGRYNRRVERRIRQDRTGQGSR